MMKQQQPKTKSFTWQQIVLIVFYGVLPFVYSERGVDPSLIPRQMAAGIFVLVTCAALFWKQQNNRVEVTFLPLVALLWFAAYAVSFPQAINRTEAFYIMLKIGLFTSVCWMMCALAKQKVLTLQVLSFAVSVSGILATLLTVINMFLLQQEGVSLFEADHMYQVNATFGHKNLLSAFLFLCLPMLVVQWVLTTKKGWKIILVLTVCILSGLLLLLQTRAVLLASVVCVVISVPLIIVGFSSVLNKRQRNSFIALVVFGTLLAGSVVYLYKDTFRLLTRTESFIERKNLWDNTRQMIAEHPLAGVGAGNWQIQMPKYGMQKFYEVNYTISEGLTNFQRPHNDFLWVWAETGIVGFIAYALLFITALIYAYRLVKQEESVGLKIAYAVFFLQIVGYMVVSSVDFPLERMEHPLILMMSLGFLAATHDSMKPRKGIEFKRWIWLLPVSLALLTLYVCTQRWQSELQLRKMYKAHATGNWQKLVVEGKKAQNPYFNMDYYSIPIQWYVGVGYFMQNNLAAAKISFEEAYQLHPYQVHVLNNYGACFEKEGNHARAIELLEESHRLSPTFSDGIINLSGAYFNAGRYEDAYRLITTFGYDDRNDRFKTFATAIIRMKLEDVLAQEKNIRFATYLRQMVSDDQAILQAYRQAQENRMELLTWLHKQVPN